MLYKNQQLVFRVVQCFLLCLLFLGSFAFSTKPVFAELIATGSAHLTAGVTDIEPPSTPVLIAPTNGAKLTNSKPTFIWQGSTDNFAVAYYVLVLNGSTKFDTIPLTATDNSDYTLTYDSDTNQYSLAIKNALGDSNYSWKITAVDIHDNQASSVTWDFAIDTKAPTFTISTIADQTVDISTEDATSVPTTPIELKENEPALSGTGESNSKIELTVKLPDGTTQEYNFTIGSDGKWAITLDTLPRDITIYLNFLITDNFGNVSILNDVPLTIVTTKIIIALPTLPLPHVIPSPVNPPAQPEIVIPIVPLPELLPPAIVKLPKQVIYYVRNYSATAKQVTSYIWSQFWWMSVILLVLLLPLLKLSLLAIWWWPYLSAQLWKQILWVIGLGPWQPPQGAVLSHLDGAFIGFSLVIVSGKTVEGLPYKKMAFSNQQGIFPQLQLPEGKYRISMQHPLYFFPTLEKKPSHLDWNTYYTGSEFTVQKDTANPLLLLVAEPLEYAQNTQAYLLRQHILELPALSLPLAVLAGCITLVFPGILNILTTIVCFGLFFWKLYKKHRNNLEATFIDPQKMPLKNVILAIRDEKKRQFTAILQSNEKGTVQGWLAAANYLTWVVDLQRSLNEGDQRSMTSYTVKDKKKKGYLPLILS